MRKIKTDAKMVKGKELTNIALMLGITRRRMESDAHLRDRLCSYIRVLGNSNLYYERRA